MKNGEYDGLTANTMKIPSKLTTQQRTVNTVVVKFRTTHFNNEHHLQSNWSCDHSFKHYIPPCDQFP